jgi:putative membrane protein
LRGKRRTLELNSIIAGGVLETTLIPSTANAELKDLLGTGLKIFQGHQQHAEHVLSDLK